MFGAPHITFTYSELMTSQLKNKIIKNGFIYLRFDFGRRKLKQMQCP